MSAARNMFAQFCIAARMISKYMRRSIAEIVPEEPVRFHYCCAYEWLSVPLILEATMVQIHVDSQTLLHSKEIISYLIHSTIVAYLA